jgi:hypothetical protein
LSTAIGHVLSDVDGAPQEAPAGTCVIHASPSWYFSANAGKPFRKEFGITDERRQAMLEFSDYAIIACIVVLFGGAAYASLRPAEGARLARLERKLDAILHHLNIAYVDPASPEGLSAEVQNLANDPAKKIQAIKLHREQTGLGLKDAKDAVEAYMNRKA